MRLSWMEKLYLVLTALTVITYIACIVALSHHLEGVPVALWIFFVELALLLILLTKLT